eukprot:1886182-Alexandrium_andersonii.AAC.1
MSPIGPFGVAPRWNMRAAGESSSSSSGRERTRVRGHSAVCARLPPSLPCCRRWPLAAPLR